MASLNRTGNFRACCFFCVYVQDDVEIEVEYMNFPSECHLRFYPVSQRCFRNGNKVISWLKDRICFGPMATSHQ